MGSRRSALAITVALLAALARTGAQVVVPNQNIAPVYEGWEENSDGSFNLVFGYFNRNRDQEIDIPTGPNNMIAPGNADQGQPTHFYPRRSRFVFRIRVPKDFGRKEVVWTLTVHGKTERAYATLHPDYIIDNDVIQANSGEGGPNPKNMPPMLKIEGESARDAKVGTPVVLTAIASDDGIPKPRPMPPPGFRSNAGGVPMTATGLRFSWLVYRSTGNVTFDPPQFSAWEDDRDGRNSPYSLGWVTPPVPPGGKWIVRATFDVPGTYVLRGLAHDGGLSASSDVTFNVTP